MRPPMIRCELVEPAEAAAAPIGHAVMAAPRTVVAADVRLDEGASGRMHVKLDYTYTNRRGEPAVNLMSLHFAFEVKEDPVELR